ncbi:unnamed protein product, partial [Discosporangium mesarthrocarpum]
MDLFKWALKLWPLLPAEELIDMLELAVECRLLDMRASPYDLSAYRAPLPPLSSSEDWKLEPVQRGGDPPPSHDYDLSPVRVETEDGRKVYQQEQLRLYRKSLPLRRRLLLRMDQVLESWG